ncbi:MAG: long-chain fatty acid transport protein [Sulfurimonas sp.]|jgi:long-chain fatty acid transport protein
MKKIALLSIVASSMLMAGGFKIPETSLNAVALSAANVAHNKSADAAYYNPANMVFMEDSNYLEVDAIYVGLDAVEYKGTAGEYDSESEKFVLPSINYVSGKAGETRIGLSISVPAGLSKRWTDDPATKKAVEFTLEAVEINPSVAIPITNKLAIGLGFRIVVSEGIIENVYYKVEGESIDYGYNLALSYKATPDLEMAMTYRSQVNLTEDGTSELTAGGTYDVSLTVPIPAIASFAVAYTLPAKTTIEFVYERTMWSAYKDVDFEYSNSSIEASLYGTAIDKNWNDTNTFRLGLTKELDKMTLMAGMVYDETPVPDDSIDYELPDSNSLGISIGGRYQVNSQYNVGLAALYSMRENRDVANDDITGKFSGGNVLMLSAGVGYKF